jgi:hypothetical protein
MDNLIDKVRLEGFKLYSEFCIVNPDTSKKSFILPENATYCWANSKCILGVGRWHSGEKSNKRVNPILNRKTIKSDKDAGKKFCAFVIQSDSKEEMQLYIKDDITTQVSRNASVLEHQTVHDLTSDKFMLYNDKTYKKDKFMNDVVYSQILNHFGKDSIEEILTKMAAGDGDLWSRFDCHEKGELAIDNILNYLEGLNNGWINR